MGEHARDLAAGERFAFGANWRRFLELLDDERIAEAERSLREMLDGVCWQGLRFVDAGCGSGLFSLAARRLGARVRSFDYDPEAVACARSLKARYFPEDADWQIDEASVLDRDWLATLGPADVIYSWGVLHHTGEMWRALELICGPLAPRGLLFIAIYNDQGAASRRWLRIKRAYNRSGPLRRILLVWVVGWYLEWGEAWDRIKRLRNPLPFAYWAARKRRRGMSSWHDLVDWVGGYPFEVAKPEALLDFYHSRGFDLVRLRTEGGSHGCNQYVFRKGSGGT